MPEPPSIGRKDRAMSNDNVVAASKALAEASATFGVSAADAAKAISEAMSLVPFDPIEEVALIQANPSLSAFQKWRLKRRLMKLATRMATAR